MDPKLIADLYSFIPELTVTGTLLLVILADLSLARIRRTLTFVVAAAGLLAAFAFTIPLFGAEPRSLFYGMIALDPMAVFFKAFLLLASLLVLLAAPGSSELAKRQVGEFYALLAGVTLGMMLLAASTDLLMLFLALETVSVGSYIMVGYLKNDRASNEAALKYLLFGAVSSGAMLYGMTLLFGLTGTTKMSAIRDVLSGAAHPGGNALMLLVATVLVIAGFGFKTAAVPFHFWCPDVYTGAPTPVTAFLSVAPKAAGFATLVRFFFTGLAESHGVPPQWATLVSINWMPIVMVLSIITMTFANIAALRQENMKRLLAYSSIAHAGYMLMGASVLSGDGLQSVLVYLITYLFMNLGAFIIVIEIYNRTGSFELKDYRGFSRRSPFLSVAMSIFLLSLMGIPPLAGFFGKFYVFAAAVNRNLVFLAVIGALNSVVAVYYYARVMKAMVIDTGEETARVRVSWGNLALIWVMLVPTVCLMLFWNPVQRLTSSSWHLFLGN
ncbi:MAG: NADH-quinone oxidoreductase subunit N [Acidobacteria bacterium]|nr:NADH-quinone oxidoreductase subunit N [Acidobacteriota bacterium]